MARKGPKYWRYPITYRARWVFPVDRPPIEGGVVLVADGKICAIEAKPKSKPDIDYGDEAIFPGFVNAHTHLDLSGAKGRISPDGGFTAWLRQVIHHRRSLTREQTRTDIESGLIECMVGGTTLVGDISVMGRSEEVLVHLPMWSVVFYEVLGLKDDRCTEACVEAFKWWLTRSNKGRCRRAMSPHSPYSVREFIFQMFGCMSEEYSFPLAVHLAESLDEQQLLKTHDGPLVSLLQELDAWDASGLVKSWEEAIYYTKFAIKRLFIHGNYLDPSTPIRKQDSIVYCPRTHAAFGHAPHPFRDFLARGVRVALGTDSLASNPDLDMLAESRFVRRLYPDLPGDVLMRMATLSGAEALGREKITGSLTVGKSADLIVLPIEARKVADPHELIWDSDFSDKRVMWRGRWLGDYR